MPSTRQSIAPYYMYILILGDEKNGFFACLSLDSPMPFSIS
jgi:hypothetical protein